MKKKKRKGQFKWKTVSRISTMEQSIFLEGGIKRPFAYGLEELEQPFLLR